MHGLGQGSLLDARTELPAGMRYVEDFLDVEEEAGLLQSIAGVAMQHARYKAYTAQRRTAGFGVMFDFEGNRVVDASPIPAFLRSLRARVAHLIQVDEERFAHALITEYSTGAALGWHRDVGAFGVIAGVSLGCGCLMRLRPYPAPAGRNGPRVNLQLAPRSMYVLRGEARWAWEHAIPSTPGLRHSITFRTQRHRSEG